jgi:hypothetical protein
MQTEKRQVFRFAVLACICVVTSIGVGAQEETPYSRDGADSCLACHDDSETLALFRSKHAVPSDARGPFGHGQLQCEACHGPGGNHAARVRRGEERPPPLVSFDEWTDAEEVAEQNGMCLGCHSEDVDFGWHAGPHESNDVACAGCHRSHTAVDPVLRTATQPDGLNDQMLVADTTTGELRRLLTGVSGCEVTGLTVTPDRRTLFANLQHPGDGDPGATNFPAATDGVTIPRDATLVIRRRDGGIVGY